MTRTTLQKAEKAEEFLLADFVDALAESRRKGVSKSQIEKQVRRYIKRMNDSLISEETPIIHLVQEIVEAGNLIGFTKDLARRKNIFHVDPVKIKGKFTNGVIHKIEYAFKEDLVDYLDEDLDIVWITKPPEELEYEKSSIKDKLLPYAFMKSWTALEFYLEMKVKTKVFQSGENLIEFAKRAQEDLPSNWKDISKVKQPIDYVENIGEIVEDYLTFPYHKFEEKSRTQLIYRQCFGIHLTSFEKISEIQKLAMIRHQLVHKGTALFGIPTMKFSYSKTKSTLELILEFAEWIEQEIIKIDKAAKHEKK